jgi:hypothetical protein
MAWAWHRSSTRDNFGSFATGQRSAKRLRGSRLEAPTCICVLLSSPNTARFWPGGLEAPKVSHR